MGGQVFDRQQAQRMADGGDVEGIYSSFCLQTSVSSYYYSQ